MRGQRESWILGRWCGWVAWFGDLCRTSVPITRAFGIAAWSTLLQRCRDRWQGAEIGTTERLEDGSYYIAGATAGGVIYCVDGAGVPGAYDISYAVMPITVETAAIAATTPTETSSGSSTAPAQDLPQARTCPRPGPAAGQGRWLEDGRVRPRGVYLPNSGQQDGPAGAKPLGGYHHGD